MRRRTLLASMALVVSLSACTTGKTSSSPAPGPSSPAGSPASSSASTTSSPASAAATQTVARGASSSTIPSWATDPLAETAAQFIIIAATPDSRLDPEPTHAWRRATTMCTKQLAQQIATQRDPYGGTWWQQLRQHDGWVAIVITNILGDQAQAPEASSASPTASITVMFTRDYHRAAQLPQHDRQVHTWTLTLDTTTHRITDFTPDAN